jgi:hypothetical protein
VSKRLAMVLILLGGFGAEPPVSLSPGALDPEPLLLALEGTSGTTWTKIGLPGDPLNVALVGTCQEIRSAFCAAGWYVADPITVRSCLGISVSVVLNLPYHQAPMSWLYLYGRTQDLAFQRPAGTSARRRHHVRFWCSGAVSSDGRPIWLGAVTFDRAVGLSHTTGKFTHHIAPWIDRERDTLMGDLWRSGYLSQTLQISNRGPTLGHNGEGDPYSTDGNVAVGVLRTGCPAPTP